MIRKSKIEYFADQLKKVSNNEKMKWKILRELINEKQLRSGIERLERDGTIITNPILISNIFASSLALNSTYGPFDDKFLFEQLKDKNFNRIPEIDQIPLNLQEVTVFEVNEAIDKLKKKNSCGLDCISVHFIKFTKHYFAQAYRCLVSKMFASSIYPSKLKCAKVIPIFKGGNMLDCSNYRPISLLSNLDKLFEALILKRVQFLTEKYNLIPKNQFGFRIKSSTINAVSEYISYVQKYSISSNSTVCSVFFDIQKAFDSIGHDVIKFKLELLNFPTFLRELIMNYLNNRSLQVSLNNILSDIFPISRGVPQGSLLGPILFNLATFDLTFFSGDCKMILYADDMVLFDRIENMKDSSYWNRFITDLKRVMSWYSLNGLTINTKKTKCLIFKCPCSSINIGDKFLKEFNIERVNTIKYLGILLDINFKWRSQISSIQKKLNRGIFVLNRCVSILRSQKLLLQLYYSFAHCHLIYLVHIWGVTNSTLISTIQILQNRCLRIIYKAQRFDSNEDIFNYFKVMKVTQLVTFYNLKFIYKIKWNLTHLCYNYELAVYEQNAFNSRQNLKNKLILTGYTKNDPHFFLFFGILEWNRLLVEEVAPISNIHLLSEKEFIEYLKTLVLKFC